VLNQDLETNLNYVNIPVLLKFYLLGGLHIYAGPQIGFLTGGTYEDLNMAGEKVEEDPADFVKSSDFSLAFGAGMDLPLNLVAEVRYNLGLSDINDITGGVESNSRVFQLSVGYRFLDKGN
jgi:hypothetical protein